MNDIKDFEILKEINFFNFKRHIKLRNFKEITVYPQIQTLPDIVIEEFAIPYKTNRYFHSIFHSLVDFLILLELKPDAKLVIFESGSAQITHDDVGNVDSRNPKIDQDLLKIFPNNTIYIPKGHKVTLKNAIGSGNYTDIISRTMCGNINLDADLLRVEILKNHFLPMLNIKQKDLRDKIFVSRSKGVHVFANQRNSMEEKHYEKFEKLFEEIGYTIIHCEDMGLIEQIEKFVNADEVVGFAGTGLANSIFCNNEPRMVRTIAFEDTARGQYWWDMLVGHAGGHYVQVKFNLSDSFYETASQIIAGSNSWLFFKNTYGFLDYARMLENE
jgi:hypothetical protein